MTAQSVEEDDEHHRRTLESFIEYAFLVNDIRRVSAYEERLDLLPRRPDDIIDLLTGSGRRWGSL